MHTRFPTERAHGHQVAHVTKACTTLGHEVTIVAPKRKNPILESAYTFYDLPEEIIVDYVPVTDGLALPLPKCIGFQLTQWSLGRALKKYLADCSSDALYIRSPSLLPIAIASGIPTYLELHSLPSRQQEKFVAECNQCHRVICLTSPMRDELVSWGADAEKIIVAGDAVDLTQFTAGEETSIDPGHIKIGYAGQLRSMGLSKGVEQLLEAANVLIKRKQNCTFLIAGGPEDVQKEMESSLESDVKRSVQFVGRLPQQDVISFLQSCDILVYPAPASDHPFYQRDTSPLKLFEYLAVQKPIVCADLPPLHDVVNEDAVLFYEPGNSAALADAIALIMKDPDAASKRAERGRAIVENCTWEKRMEQILKK